MNIWVAAADNKLDVVKNFIESGKFSANSKDVNGYTPIHAAVSYGHLDLLDYLLSKGGDINIQDTEGDSPLHHAEDVQVAKYLVEKLSANPKLKNNDGQTPLEYIEEDGEFPELIQYLTSLQADSVEVPLITDSLPKDGDVIEGHEIRYTYETQPNEISLMGSLSEEQRELKLREIAESENPEELLRDLVKTAVHEHLSEPSKKRKS